MNKLDLSIVTSYVETNIGEFHGKRLKRLQGLELNDVLKRKNPYLFKAKNLLTSETLIRSLLEAHLSSQEETIFGDFLEGLCILICENVYGGGKSNTEGIDLEFTHNGIRYVIALKSGPNWGNSSQLKKMLQDFRKAETTYRTNNPKGNMIAVNGCCYGRTARPVRKGYFKLCGQEFWEFLSGDSNLYTDMIEPLGHKAEERNQEFLEGYAQVVNLFSEEFMESFCVKGIIDWNKLVKFNSERIRKNKLDLL